MKVFFMLSRNHLQVTIHKMSGVPIGRINLEDWDELMEQDGMQKLPQDVLTLAEVLFPDPVKAVEKPVEKLNTIRKIPVTCYECSFYRGVINGELDCELGYPIYSRVDLCYHGKLKVVETKQISCYDCSFLERISNTELKCNNNHVIISLDKGCNDGFNPVTGLKYGHREENENPLYLKAEDIKRPFPGKPLSEVLKDVDVKPGQVIFAGCLECMDLKEINCQNCRNNTGHCGMNEGCLFICRECGKTRNFK